MGAKHQKFSISIPKSLDDIEREELADLIIEHIRSRSEKGLDKNNEPFPPYSGDNKKKGKYSKAYADSLDFKIAGKSPSKLNLTLSGDMLASIELLESEQGRLTIGFEKGSNENAKADGNIRGTYGQNKKVTAGRKFLGINASDKRRIIDEYVSTT